MTTPSVERVLRIRLTGTITADHQLVLDVPPEIPVGTSEVEVMIPLREALSSVEVNEKHSAHEIIRSQLREAGFLAESDVSIEGDEISDEMLWEWGDQLPPGPSVQELIDDNRGD